MMLIFKHAIRGYGMTFELRYGLVIRHSIRDCRYSHGFKALLLRPEGSFLLNDKTVYNN